jgi:hypothetical protein
VEVVASLTQGRTAVAQCGLFTQKSVPVIFEPPCMKFTISWYITILNSSTFVALYVVNTRWCSWLRYCATSRKAAGLIPDGVIVIFH